MSANNCGRRSTRPLGSTTGCDPTILRPCSMISSPGPASRRAIACSRWGARRVRRPARWCGVVSGSPASNSAPNWPRPPGSRQQRPGELADDRAEIEASGLFEVTAVRHYDWERVYPAEEYIELLSTFSGHLAMPDWKRKRLYGEIRRRLALRPDHSVRRHWGAVLQVARRREHGVASTTVGGWLSPDAAAHLLGRVTA